MAKEDEAPQTKKAEGREKESESEKSEDCQPKASGILISRFSTPPISPVSI